MRHQFVSVAAVLAVFSLPMVGQTSPAKSQAATKIASTAKSKTYTPPKTPWGDPDLQGNWPAARELHYRLLPLMEANFLESNPGPVKAAMALMGLLEENFRLPLVPVQEKTKTRLQEVLHELGALQRHVAA